IATINPPFSWHSFTWIGFINGRTCASCLASPLPRSVVAGRDELLRQWNEFVRRGNKSPPALAEIHDSLHRDRVCGSSLALAEAVQRKHYNFVIFSLPCLLLPSNPLPCQT